MITIFLILDSSQTTDKGMKNFSKFLKESKL